MVCATVEDGSPPPVCFFHSHQEKARGSIAVPPDGPPQATVACALSAVELTPRMGAKRWRWTPLVRTLTLPVVGLSPGVSTVAVSPTDRLFSLTIDWAVCDGVPQVGPRPQSWAMASAPASAAV